ncbi:SCO4225 family membrane protein [Streptomyces sp. NPDC091376]|uniref:SCO4225 family membrane protein n=1 Tax=Streptomyces sp. NPDC091376 TaxID=3365994 RepID=UPI00380AA72A
MVFASKEYARPSVLFRLAIANCASLAYLAAVAAVALFVTVDTFFVAHEDASLAAFLLFMMAAPTFFVFLSAGSVLGVELADSAWIYPALVLSVLFQSLLLGLLARYLGSRQHTGQGPGARS